ncbi:MAG: hypothetical protein JRI25_13305 [Deltaproteobacteria bacterium]|nr:hypothetical protein [Deltaproteobacteria bacterium]MBW2255561.1 hypothetical protein [Deltaproteobacteria bacterium]
MTDESLNELFGEGSGQPVPRTRLAIILLVTGLVLALLGMACSAAPGGLVVLVAWVVIEKELDRVDSGYLPTEFKPRLLALQRVTYAAVVLVLLLFVVQFFLMCNGTMEAFWGRLVTRMWEIVTRMWGTVS